jgi:hypothetical protein
MEDNQQDMIDFIVMRADNADKAYVQASDDGKNGLECEDAGYDALFAGLEFSPFFYLIETCVDLYGYEMTKEEALEIYRYQEVKDIFDKYGNDIEGDDKEYQLIEELTPYLKRYDGKGVVNQKFSI